MFASPRVKKFLRLQSFSNTVSPSESPPSGSRRDANTGGSTEYIVEESALSTKDGQMLAGTSLYSSITDQGWTCSSVSYTRCDEFWARVKVAKAAR